MEVVNYQDWISAPERAKSEEWDFGAWWKLNGTRWWRLSYITTTRELYAVHLSGLRTGNVAVVLEQGRSREEIEKDIPPEKWNGELSELYPELRNFLFC